MTEGKHETLGDQYEPPVHARDLVGAYVPDRPGHEFHISVGIRGYSEVSGDPDSGRYNNYIDEPITLMVQAHNLRDALKLAAQQPFEDWFREEEAPADFVLPAESKEPVVRYRFWSEVKVDALKLQLEQAHQALQRVHDLCDAAMVGRIYATDTYVPVADLLLALYGPKADEVDHKEEAGGTTEQTEAEGN